MPGQSIRMMSSGKTYEVTELGVFLPQMAPVDRLGPGEVGCVLAGIKNVGDTRIGDTITHAARPAAEPLPGYRPIKPLVFCGLYPVGGEGVPALRDAL